MPEGRIWLNSEGKVLVNSVGRPFLTDSCCCSSGSGSDSSLFCYHDYVAYCVGPDGQPAYSDGQQVVQDVHWTVPVLEGWSCGPEDSVNINMWVLDAPGSAHYRMRMSKEEDEPPCGSLTCGASYSPPPLPDLPCSCSIIWSGASTINLPTYTYAVPIVECYVYDTRGPAGSTLVSDYMLPIWDIDSFIPGQGPYGSRIGKIAYRGVRVANWYFGNLEIGKLDTPAEYRFFWDSTRYPDSSAAYRAYESSSAAYMSDRNSGWTGSYLIRSATGTSGRYSYVASCVPVPGRTDVWALSNSRSDPAESRTLSNNMMFIRGDTLYSADLALFNGHADNVLQSVGSVVYETTRQYRLSSNLPYTHYFGNDQWGYIKATPQAYVSGWDSNETAYAHVLYAREPRGAVGPSVASGSMPVVTGTLTADPLNGCPGWFHRLLLTTDAPIADINNANWKYACRDSNTRYSSNHELSVAAGVAAMFCPLYYNVVVAVEWPFCGNDPAMFIPVSGGQGSLAYCSGVRTGESAISTWTPLHPLFQSLFGSYDQQMEWHYTTSGTSTVWAHEADEPDASGNVGMRSINTRFDGHAYKCMRLNKYNFPTWYLSGQCLAGINPDQYEVPRIDYGDYAYYCSQCGHAPYLINDRPNSKSCGWPYTHDYVTFPNDTVDYLSSDIYNVYRIEYERVTLRPTAVQEPRMITAYSNVQSDAEGVYIDVTNWFKKGSGCPDWNWYMTGEIRMGIWREACYSGPPFADPGERYWFTIPPVWSIWRPGSSTWYGAPFYDGSFTHKGAVFDSYYHCYSGASEGDTASSHFKIRFPLSSDNSWHYEGDSRTRWSYAAYRPLVMVYQLAGRACMNGSVLTSEEAEASAWPLHASYKPLSIADCLGFSDRCSDGTVWEQASVRIAAGNVLTARLERSSGIAEHVELLAHDYVNAPSSNYNMSSRSRIDSKVIDYTVKLPQALEGVCSLSSDVVFDETAEGSEMYGDANTFMFTFFISQGETFTESAVSFASERSAYDQSMHWWNGNANSSGRAYTVQISGDGSNVTTRDVPAGSFTMPVTIARVFEGQQSGGGSYVYTVSATLPAWENPRYGISPEGALTYSYKSSGSYTYWNMPGSSDHAYSGSGAYQQSVSDFYPFSAFAQDHYTYEYTANVRGADQARDDYGHNSWNYPEFNGEFIEQNDIRDTAGVEWTGIQQWAQNYVSSESWSTPSSGSSGDATSVVQRAGGWSYYISINMDVPYVGYYHTDDDNNGHLIGLDTEESSAASYLSNY